MKSSVVFALLFTVCVIFENTNAAPAKENQHTPSGKNKTSVLNDDLDNTEGEATPVSTDETGNDEDDGNADFADVEAAPEFEDVDAEQPDDELGQFFEGDIASIDPNVSDDEMDNAIKGANFRWPSATVPYVVSKGFTREEMSKIKAGMDTYQKLTCIKWAPRTNQPGYVHFQNTDSGCYSTVGRTGKRQVLNYGNGCFTSGTVLHEMMHAVGFFHEQSRSDRDQFVKIHLENVQKGTEGNFRKVPDSETVNFGFKYDYGSVMHYSSTAFSTALGKITIEPLEKNAKIGQRTRFSETDVKKIKAMYRC